MVENQLVHYGLTGSLILNKSGWSTWYKGYKEEFLGLCKQRERGAHGAPSTKNSRCLLNAWKSSNGQPAANSHLRNSSQTNWRRVHQNLNYSRSSSGKRHEKCCTHRPSLLPIEWLSEAFGLAQGEWQHSPRAGKLFKLGHLEEVKVVTRFSWNTPLKPWSQSI